MGQCERKKPGEEHFLVREVEPGGWDGVRLADKGVHRQALRKKQLKENKYA